jgi:hypothetical protein
VAPKNGLETATQWQRVLLPSITAVYEICEAYADEIGIGRRLHLWPDKAWEVNQL